ncbi:MAG: F0F1 ATP synthase subunit gamma [Candidatus Zixiibacteriota bacterium]
MPSLRDIKRRIRSVKSTQQITKAMEMVAAAKLRKAQNRAEQARPYAEKMKQILANLSSSVDAGDGNVMHPYFETREVKRTTLVLITSDRGLCGSFNANLIRRAARFLEEYSSDSVEMVTIGKRGTQWYRKRPYSIISSHVDFGGNMDFDRARDIARELTDRFESGETDEIYLLYQRFISTARQQITLERYLPIEPEAVADDESAKRTDYIFEPDPAAIFDDLMPRYAMTMLQTAMAESFAAEHAARMMAMGAATKSAGEMIDALTLQFNKARQGAITKELLDIVGGAEALAKS